MSSLGFGLMRLPGSDGQFDKNTICRMIDKYLDSGFNYFDTAYTYAGSEAITKEVLTDRYPREHFRLATKLNAPYVNLKTYDECERYFTEQLIRTGTDYFDYYLMHGVISYQNYRLYKNAGFFDFVEQKKKEGKIRYNGFSFHGDSELLKLILKEQPQTEFVQIQINYIDWNSPIIESKKLYDILHSEGIPITVMEPVKGGLLASMPPEIEKMLNEIRPGMSMASWALRFVASLEGVGVVLSGMSNEEHVDDNLKTFEDFKPLSGNERQAIEEVVKILNSSNQIPCTACEYCIEGCPKNINIPRVFKIANENRRLKNDNVTKMMYNLLPSGQKPEDCISCKKCEKVCPQKLPISGLLKEIISEFN